MATGVSGSLAIFTAILRAALYDESVSYLLEESATVIGKSVMAGLAG
jgi:hypothetical protein